MTELNLVYIVGKRTSANSSTARHIADANGLPICWSTRRMSGKARGSGFVRDSGEPTCKRCIKLQQEQRTSD